MGSQRCDAVAVEKAGPVCLPSTGAAPWPPLFACENGQRTDVIDASRRHRTMARRVFPRWNGYVVVDANPWKRLVRCAMRPAASGSAAVSASPFRRVAAFDLMVSTWVGISDGAALGDAGGRGRVLALSPTLFR